jgi:hypothetical protein
MTGVKVKSDGLPWRGLCLAAILGGVVLGAVGGSIVYSSQKSFVNQLTELYGSDPRECPGDEGHWLREDIWRLARSGPLHIRIMARRALAHPYVCSHPLYFGLSPFPTYPLYRIVLAAVTGAVVATIVVSIGVMRQKHKRIAAWAFPAWIVAVWYVGRMGWQATHIRKTISLTGGAIGGGVVGLFLFSFLIASIHET